VRLWIDTDVGDDPDDAVALLCAAAHPDVELVGVSTVDGDTRARADIARSLVDAPVMAGADLDPLAVRDTDADALLAIGPLTNVARLHREAALPPRVGIMGGALEPVQHRGERMTIEHNFGRDPSATRTVLGSRDGLLICPLDATVRTCVDDQTAARIAAADARLEPAIGGWLELGRRLCLHDPVALLALLDEPMVRVEERRLMASTEGLVAVEPGGRPHRVVVDVDAPAAVDRISTLVDQGRR